MSNNTSPHILNTSANLLGLCLIVITSFHVTNNSAASIIDELTSVVAVMLVVSCTCSFLSIRTKRPTRGYRLENIADYLFIASLAGILIIILLIMLNFIR